MQVSPSEWSYAMMCLAFDRNCVKRKIYQAKSFAFAFRCMDKPGVFMVLARPSLFSREFQ